jgi:hypothetical protein
MNDKRNKNMDHWLNKELDDPQGRCARYEGEAFLLPLQGIETRSLIRISHSPVAIPTELSRHRWLRNTGINEYWEGNFRFFISFYVQTLNLVTLRGRRLLRSCTVRTLLCCAALCGLRPCEVPDYVYIRFTACNSLWIETGRTAQYMEAEAYFAQF